MMRAIPMGRCVTCFCGQCAASEINQVYALNSALDQAYSVFGIGIVFFDKDKNLIHLNDIARMKLKLPEAFILMEQDLIEEVFNHQSRLNIKNAMDQLLHSDSTNEIHLNVTIKNEQNSIMLQRLEKSAFGIDASGVAMFIFESTPDDETLSTDISRIFGLTKAEARLTHAIAHGMTAAEYSEKHGISINTTYSQIKNILSKTGTRRQAELIKLVIEHSPNLERRKSQIPIFADRRKQ